MCDLKKVKARKIHIDKFVSDSFEAVKEDSNVNFTQKDELKSMGRKKLKKKKIRMSMTKAEEIALDKAIDMDNKVSTLFIVVVLVLCFIVGISLGCFLYKIALTGTL